MLWDGIAKVPAFREITVVLRGVMFPASGTVLAVQESVSSDVMGIVMILTAADITVVGVSRKWSIAVKYITGIVCQVQRVAIVLKVN